MSTTTQSFYEAVYRTALLTPAQETEVARAIEAGCYADYLIAAGDPRPGLDAVARRGQEAKTRMIESNLRLVKWVAASLEPRGLSRPEMIQEGVFGLIRAIEGFDFARGGKFSTYAVYWIRQTIDRAIGNQGRAIRLPVHVLGRPDEEQVRAGLVQISLETLLAEVSEEAFLESVPDHCDEVLDASSRRDLTGRVEEILRRVDRRLPGIIAARMGFRTGEVETLDAVGTGLGVTRERIRQVEMKGMEALRAQLAHPDPEPEPEVPALEAPSLAPALRELLDRSRRRAAAEQLLRRRQRWVRDLQKCALPRRGRHWAPSGAPLTGIAPRRAAKTV